MRCPGRDLLTNDNIISIFQACFRIGHYQTERSKDMSGRQLCVLSKMCCVLQANAETDMSSSVMAVLCDRLSCPQPSGHCALCVHCPQPSALRPHCATLLQHCLTLYQFHIKSLIMPVQASILMCCYMHVLTTMDCLAELLTQASRQIMIEMVSIVFKGLADIPDIPMTPTTARSLADLAHSPRLQVSPGSAQGPLLNPFSGGTVASTAG